MAAAKPKIPIDEARRVLRGLKAREGGTIRGRRLMPLVAPQEVVAPPDVLDMGLGWYAVHTEVRQENAVRAALKDAGFDPFLPIFTRTVSHSRRVYERKLPLFPGYVFVGFNPDSRTWGAINGLKGVDRLLEVGEKPLRIPDHLMATIMVDDLLKAHDDIVYVKRESNQEPMRKRVSKKDRSWRGRKDRIRMRNERRKAKAMAEFLADALAKGKKP